MSIGTKLSSLDHLGKPRIAAGGLQPYADAVRGLVRRPNVVCKVSGMVTEADPQRWSPDQLKPYFETVFEAFTPARLIAAPTGLCFSRGAVTCGGERCCRSGFSEPSPNERADFLGRTAVRTYRFTVPGFVDQ